MTQELSVIIPVYNGEKYVAQAVASVLRQDPPVAEIIVVDDGSTDGTAKIVEGLTGVRYVQQSNQGPAAARNHGLRISQGNLLCFLDADDQLTATKTQVQFPMLAESSEVDIVVGFSQRVVIMRWDGDAAVYEEIGDPLFNLHPGSAIIRRPVFDRVGLFEENLAMGEEVDWFLRSKESGIRMRFHPEIMQYRLRHDSNMTLQSDVMNQYFIRALKRSLDRRRSPGAPTQSIAWDWSEETRMLSNEAHEHE